MRAPPSNSRDSFSSLPAGERCEPSPAVSKDAACRISRGSELSRNRCPLCCSPHPANSLLASNLISMHISLPPFMGMWPTTHRTQLPQRILALQVLFKVTILPLPHPDHAPGDSLSRHSGQ